jgi:hypothetical protein
VRPEYSRLTPQNYRSQFADLFFFDRHPLQEQTVDTFVPNDILIVGGAGIGVYRDPAVDDEGEGENNLMSEGSVVLGNSVVICTGANACGKVKRSSILFFFG